MPKQSAGLLVFRRPGDTLEALLVHPGGPFWAKKDDGAWSIPKGELTGDEEPLAAARREFAEETGFAVSGDFLALGSLRQPSRKIVHAWAVEGDADPAEIHSNTFALEWPPQSGRMQEFPEVDRAGWFSLEEAHVKIHKGQAAFLDRLVELLGESDLTANR